MATVNKNSVRNNQVINDFGQKIGGAHKDRAREAAAALYGVDASALMLKPLSKVAKLPDLRALYLAGSIDEATARRAWFLWSQIGTKPGGAYPSRLKRWADNAAAIIEAVADVLTYGEPEKSQLPEGVRVVQSWELFSEEMNAANWPADDYKRGAYFVGDSWYESGYSIRTEKKSYYKKYNTVADCVAAIREMVGDNSTKGTQQFSMYKTRAGVYYITPKGKQGIKLVEFNNEADAWAAYRDSQKLEEIYNELRKFPSERRDWNRPRVGNDYRQGRDMSPEAFAEVFPFRGVEFGNWVNQIERAACLNEAADALQDLAAIIGIRPEAVALDGSLAWAFGSRGVGRALAHYETGRRVVNLTKKKGNGCIAHEWFHALDHFVMIQQGRPSFMAVSDSVAYGEAEKSQIRRAAYDLKKALNASEMCKRAARIDAFKAKAYWSTVTELAARGFEAVIYYKLQAAGLCNDYLVNFKECNEWSRPDCYPYPTKEEAAELAPLYDAFIAAAFSEAERAPIAEGVAYGDAEKSQISEIRPEVEALRARARNAGRLTSFDPEKLGDSFISELENALRAFESQLPEEIRAEKVAAYISKWSEWLAARSRCISSAITGPARFPVARAEKLNEYERNAWNRLQEWADKVVKRCNAEKRLTGWEEVERLTAKAEKLEHLQELMKSANKIVRQRVSDIEKLDALVALGFSEKWANEIMTPDCMGHIGFASFELSNNLAKIKDARAKIARHEALAGKEDHTEAYEWGELEFCYSEERYRLHFPGKPSAEILNFLKSHGWKWSRANCAWQRQITNGAAYNLRQFIEKFGGKVKPSAEVHASEPMNEEPAEEPNAPSNGAQGSAYGDAQKSQISMNPGEVYKTAKADRYIIILSDDGEKLSTTDAIRGRFSGNIDTSDKDRFLSCLDAGSIIKADASQLPPVTDVHAWREGLEHGYGKAFEIRTELIYTASDSMTEAEKADTAARMGFSLPLDPLAVLQVSALHKWNASRGNYRHCAALEWLVSQQDEPTAFKMNAGAYPVIFADYARRI